MIHKLIKELKTGELVNPLAKNSDTIDAIESALRSRSVQCIDANDPRLLEAAMVDDHYVSVISGGNNGNGHWCNYFDQLSSIIDELNERGYKAWLIELKNDCPDDVWYAYIGFTECKDEDI